MKKICIKERKHWSFNYGPDCGEEVTVINMKDFNGKSYYLLAEYTDMPPPIRHLADRMAYQVIHFIDPPTLAEIA